MLHPDQVYRRCRFFHNCRDNIREPQATAQDAQLLNDSLRFVVDNDEHWAGLTNKRHHLNGVSNLEKRLPGRLCVIITILLISSACNSIEANSSPTPTQAPVATKAPSPTGIPSLIETSLPTETRTPSETLSPTETPSPTGISSPTEILVMVTGSTLTRLLDGMVMMYVPEGEFTMGNDAGPTNERPQHTVYLDAYWIDRTEVTNAMFALFVEATGYQTNAEKQGAA